MADKKTVVAVGIVAGLAALGIAAAASASEDEEPTGTLPPPRVRPPTGGGLTPKQLAMQHPNYQDWLYATEQCDEALASGDPGSSSLLGFCDDAAYFAGVMVNDGVPPGQWR